MAFYLALLSHLQRPYQCISSHHLLTLPISVPAVPHLFREKPEKRARRWLRWGEGEAMEKRGNAGGSERGGGVHDASSTLPQ